jgi:hypothetical protein
VEPAPIEYLEVEICSGSHFVFNGTSISSPGVYLDTLTSAEGCDSIVELDLTVAPVLSSNFNVEICAGGSYSFHGEEIEIAGTYTDSIITSQGCDSIVTLELSVDEVIFSNLSVEICSGGSFYFAGDSISEAGIYLDSLQTAEGCDSIVELELIVAPLIEHNITADFCAGGTYLFHGMELNSPGIYSDTLKTSDGCDSVVLLELNEVPALSSSFTDEICAGGSYNFHGEILTEEGTYVDTLNTSNGCDSIVTLELIISPSLSNTLSVDICEGTTYDFHGESISLPGVYEDTLLTVDGCDSIIVLELYVEPALETELEVEICEGG